MRRVGGCPVVGDMRSPSLRWWSGAAAAVLVRRCCLRRVRSAAVTGRHAPRSSSLRWSLRQHAGCHLDRGDQRGDLWHSRADRSDDTRAGRGGTRLAFVSTRDGSSQIWVAGISPTGSAAGTPRKLTGLATEAAGPRWSPDGWVAFVSDVFPECDSVACNDAMLKEPGPGRQGVFDQLLFRHWTRGRTAASYLRRARRRSAQPRDLTSGGPTCRRSRSRSRRLRFFS
jgi:hypothetical protein